MRRKKLPPGKLYLPDRSLYFSLFCSDGKTIAISVNNHHTACMDVSAKNISCRHSLHILLKESLQRTGTIDRIISVLYNVSLGCICKLDLKFFVLQIVLFTSAIIRSTMCPMLSFVSGLNRMISSRRFRNSGLK